MIIRNERIIRNDPVNLFQPEIDSWYSRPQIQNWLRTDVHVRRHHLDGSHNQVIFSKPVYFPTTSSFQIQLIIIPELVSSDNSNQKQLEALVVNHEPQSAGEMTNGWSIWQFKIAGHMDSQSIIIIRFNLCRTRDGPTLRFERPADDFNGPNGDKTWDWNFEKMFILGFRHVRQQKTWDWSSLN